MLYPESPALTGLQDDRNTVAAVKHLIVKLQTFLQLGLTQFFLPPACQKQICFKKKKKGSLPEAQLMDRFSLFMRNILLLISWRSQSILL